MKNSIEINFLLPNDIESGKMESVISLKKKKLEIIQRSTFVKTISN